MLWIATPQRRRVDDFNNQANPMVAVIGGRRLVIGGGADGWIYALRAETGELQWKFQMSQKSLNSPVTVVGNTVYATSNGEPVDGNFIGQVVALDGTGTGDVTATARLWNTDAVMAGFAAPVFDAGRLYVVDNAANLHALDAKTGRRSSRPTSAPSAASAPLLRRRQALRDRGQRPRDDPEGALADRFEVLDQRRAHHARGAPDRDLGRLRRRLRPALLHDRGRPLRLGDKAKPFPAAPGEAAAAAERSRRGRAAARPAAVLIVPAEAQSAGGRGPRPSRCAPSTTRASRCASPPGPRSRSRA